MIITYEPVDVLWMMLGTMWIGILIKITQLVMERIN